MDTIECSRCLRLLPEGEFHRNRAQPKGRCHYCRDCRRDYYRGAKRAADHSSKTARTTKQRHPERWRARKAIQRAMRRGVLPRAKEMACFDCGKPAHRWDHHLGYSREHWLTVQAVCFVCDGLRTRIRNATQASDPMRAAA